MTNEVIAALWGAGSGAVVSGLVSFISSLVLDQRREARVDGKVIAAREDCIRFVKLIKEIQKDISVIDRFLEDVKVYRALRISDALEKMRLVSFLSSSGGLFTKAFSPLNHYEEKDIEEMIRDISKGAYDSLFIFNS
jgi:hypothetical protein